MRINELPVYNLVDDEMTIEGATFLDCYMPPEMLRAGSFPVQMGGYLYIDFYGGRYRE